MVMLVLRAQCGAGSLPKIGPVDYDDIDTIHEILAYTKKNKTFDPTLSSYVPNTQKGIKYAITGVYLGSDEENQQVPYMKVSFLLRVFPFSVYGLVALWTCSISVRC